MDLSYLFLQAMIVGVAVGAPWWLAFDHAGLRRAAGRPGAGRWLFLTAATLFSAVFAVGFVALGALGAGALLARDGLAAAEALLPLWLPLLVVSAAGATRRYAPAAA